MRLSLFRLDRVANFAPGRKCVCLAALVGILVNSGFGGDVAQAQSTNNVAAIADEPAPKSTDSGLPLTFARQTGDLNAMVKRGSIRALVLYSRSGFFYVNGLPEGIYYEGMQYFERFVNQKLHSKQHVQVTYIPVRPDQLEAALTEAWAISSPTD